MSNDYLASHGVVRHRHPLELIEARDLIQEFASEVAPVARLAGYGVCGICGRTPHKCRWGACPGARLRRLVHLADVFLGDENCAGCDDHDGDEEREPESVGYAKDNPRGGWNT